MFSDYGLDITTWASNGIAGATTLMQLTLKQTGVMWYLYIGVGVAVVLHLLRAIFKRGSLPDMSGQVMPAPIVMGFGQVVPALEGVEPLALPPSRAMVHVPSSPVYANAEIADWGRTPDWYKDVQDGGGMIEGEYRIIKRG